MSGRGCVALLCTYTSQKTKKRKTYADGKLLVDPQTRRVVLQSADENRLVKDALEVQFLSPQQIQALLRGACTELEMDGFLVSIDRHQPSASASSSFFASSSSSSGQATAAAVVKPKRFKPPQRIAPPLQQQQQQQQQQELSHASDPYQRQQFNQVEAGGVVPPARTVVRGKYCVTEDELDDIWGTDNEATGSSYPEEGIDAAPPLLPPPQTAPRAFAPAAAVPFEGRRGRHEPPKQPQPYQRQEQRTEPKAAAPPPIATTDDLWEGYFAPATVEADENGDDEARAIDELFAIIPNRPHQPQAAPAPAPAPAPQISRAPAPLPVPAPPPAPSPAATTTTKRTTTTKKPEIAPPQQRTTEDLLSLFG